MPRQHYYLPVVLAWLALGASPSAAVSFTSSQVTTPSDPTFPWYETAAPGTLHVEGDVAGGDSNADIVCFQGSTGRVLLKTNVTVASGHFSDDVPLKPLYDYNSRYHPFCVLRAVPTGDAASYPPG